MRFSMDNYVLYRKNAGSHSKKAVRMRGKHNEEDALWGSAQRATEQVLSTAMPTMWISFAKNASPNNALIPSWRYNSAADSYLQLNDAMTAEAQRIAILG
jgi:hypothetical protein